MNLNDISFTLLQGGSGALDLSPDMISGLLFYNDTRPAAFTAALTTAGTFSNGGVIQIFSAQQAANIGINDSYSDETQATGTVQITSIGSNGDTLNIAFQEWKSGYKGKGLVSLGTYTKVSGDTTVALIATGVAAAINALTNSHGYSAVAVSDTVTITVRKGLGVYPNTGSPFVKTIVGTIAATVVQNVVAGIASKLAVYYYHINRYFIKKPDGTLYLGIFNAAGATAFADIANVMNYSGNTMVQLGIWDDTKVFAPASLTAIQTQVTALFAQSKILSNVIYAADIAAIGGGVATLAGGTYNLANLSNPNVSSVIDNDGNGIGFDLYKQVGKSITSLGAAIGCESAATVGEDYGNLIPKFDCNDGVDFDTLMFGDGTMYSNVPQSELDALNGNRFVFLSKARGSVGSTGSWYSDDHCAVSTTSDFAYAHDNRTIGRVIRNSFVVLQPLLKAKGSLKSDGTLTQTTIDQIIATEFSAISPLIGSGDLAGDLNSIDPSNYVLVSASQKPNLTGKLLIGVRLVKNGIFHAISVPIGYGTF